MPELIKTYKKHLTMPNCCDNIVKDEISDRRVRAASLFLFAIMINFERAVIINMSYSKTEAAALQLAEPIALSDGFYVYDIEYVKEGGLWFLRVYIDKDGGISMDECEVFSRKLSAALDSADPIDGNYYLEVSSPGIERKLKTNDHFIRYIGEMIDISLYKALDGNKNLTGTLKNFVNDEITLLCGEKEYHIPLSAAAKVNLHFDFDL